MSTPPDPSFDLIQHLLGGLPDPFFAVDAGWRFTFVNDHAAQFVGRPGEADALRGRHLWETFPEAAQTPLFALGYRVMELRHLESVEVHYPPVDSWIELRAFPFLDGIAVHYRDITPRKEAEAAREHAQKLVAELQAQSEALERANEQLQAFAHSVAHDLRTPVRHVLTFSGLARTALGERLDPRTSRYLDTVEGAGQRMNGVIDAMLSLARAATVPLHHGPVPLQQVVERAQEDVAPDLDHRSVEWQVQPLPVVQGDAATLQQVMTNLVSNAVKYTRTRDVARIAVWAQRREGDWVISVQDNGIGFDPTHAEQLFRVFGRLHGASDFEGIGVGLANVKRIVERHGGQVWADARPEHGATFAFTLPDLTLQHGMTQQD